MMTLLIFATLFAANIDAIFLPCHDLIILRFAISYFRQHDAGCYFLIDARRHADHATRLFLYAIFDLLPPLLFHY